MESTLTVKELRAELKNNTNLEKAKILQGFFKTGKGQYGEGDKFLGIVVPVLRRISKKYIHLELSEIKSLLKGKYHEERLVGLFILVLRFNKAEESGRKDIYNFYLHNMSAVNNWDLVDLTAPNIAGQYLADKDKSVLYKFAKSSNLWERRVAMLATFNFIRSHEHEVALKVADILVNDKQDLIQKAVGWMLREVGKHCGEGILKDFLKTRYGKMPRTMLRYAIERFSEAVRKQYLSGTA
jgi:3-methyladenine DNA glycosylase AlkD